MPGLHTFDQSPNSDESQAICAFDKSHTSQIRINSVFRTPRTPSTASSTYLSVPSSANLTSSTHLSRKRSRHESADLSVTYSTSANHRWSNVSSSVPASKVTTPEVISPVPFVNTKYRLAGGLDTPTASAAFSYDENTYNGHCPDQAYRRGSGWSNNGSTTSESYFPQFSSALARDGNGRKRGHSNTPSAGWGKAVVTAFGGVAGKVWEFCRMGAFRGFYAGGGQGYAMTPPASSYESDSHQSNSWLDETASTSAATTPFTSINLPGNFPDSDFIPDYLSHNHTPPSRPAKRLHLENNDPSATWVLITSNTNSPSLSRDPTPSRIPIRKPIIKQPASSPSPRRRPTLIPVRSSTSSSSYIPNLPQTPRPASCASVRSPLTTPTRANHSPRAHAHATSTTTSPTKHKHGTSSLSPDALRFQAEIRRRDEEGDRELARLNRRLKDMIREGKEALGTKVEVMNIDVDGDSDSDGDGDDWRGGG